MKVRWIDVHGHLTDPRLDDCREDWIRTAIQSGIQGFVQGGIGPKDWLAQQDLKKKYPDQIGLCFGLHPYWVAQNSSEDCESALNQLAREIPQALLLGECGLDFRPEFAKQEADFEKQMHFFEMQLELATMSGKPVVLHLVRAHQEALQIFKFMGVPAQRGFVHSFNGSWGQAQDFLKKGFLISLGGPVARQKNTKLHEVARLIPLESLLIETDTPDQPGDQYRGQLNPLQGLFEVARVIGEIRKISPLEILDISASNFKRLLGKSCPWT